MQLKFWKKPIGDKDTFQLVLFLLGNGCAPYLLKRWIMLSQLWATHQYHRREESPANRLRFKKTRTPKPTFGFITILTTKSIFISTAFLDKNRIMDNEDKFLPADCRHYYPKAPLGATTSTKLMTNNFSIYFFLYPIRTLKVVK